MQESTLSGGEVGGCPEGAVERATEPAQLSRVPVGCSARNTLFLFDSTAP